MKRRQCVVAALFTVAPSAYSLPADVADITRLRQSALHIPVSTFAASEWHDRYLQALGGERVHAALDIPANRGTPVLAVEDGRIAKLFLSAPGSASLTRIAGGFFLSSRAPSPLALVACSPPASRET